MQQTAPAALVYVWLLTEWVVFMWLKWFHCSLSVSIWPVFFSGISARLACQHPSYPSSHLHLIRVTKCASVFFSVVLTSKACSCLLRRPPFSFSFLTCAAQRRGTLWFCVAVAITWFWKMIVYMSNVHAVIYIAWHCQHFYLQKTGNQHYTAVFRNSVIIPNEFMLSIVCFWFSFLMGWLRARQRIRTALGSSRNTFGSSLCSSKNSDCCMNAVWKWPLTWRRDQLRLEKTFADTPPQKTKQKQTNIFSITTI